MTTRLQDQWTKGPKTHLVSSLLVSGLLVSGLWSALGATAVPVPAKGVQVNGTNGVLLTPANFFDTNVLGIIYALTNAGFATGSGGSGTFDFAALTNKPPPILLLSTNNGGSLTNLNASRLDSGTIPDARFPAVLPAISGANLTDISGSGIPTSGGKGTNTDLLTPKFRTSLTTSNGILLFYPLDPAGVQRSGPFGFTVSTATNNWTPGGSNEFRFHDDNQMDFGYNMASLPGHNPGLPSWVQGLETTWFAGGTRPTMEWYQRITLTNGINTGGLTDYVIDLSDGSVTGDLNFNTLKFTIPQLADPVGNPWLIVQSVVESATTGSGTMTFLKGSLEFGAGVTNVFPISQNGVGLISRTDGLNRIFNDGPSATFFVGDNTSSYLKPVVVTSNGPSIIWNGTNSPQRWEYSDLTGTRRPLNPFPVIAGIDSQLESHFAIPQYLNVAAGNGSWRRLGWLTNDVNYLGSGIVEINLLGGYGTVQRYVIPRGNLDTATTWQECLPTHQRMGYGTDNFYAVDVQKAGGATEFRVRRISGADGGNFYGDVIVHSLEKFVIDTSVTGTSGTVSQIFSGTALTQMDGKVGINTNNPFTELHVVGNQLTTGTNEAAYFKGSALLLTDLPSSGTVQTNILVSNILDAGDAAYSNANAFELSGSSLNATQKLDLDLRTAIANSATNGGGSSATGMNTNQFTTNVMGQPIIGAVSIKPGTSDGAVLTALKVFNPGGGNNTGARINLSYADNTTTGGGIRGYYNDVEMLGLDVAGTEVVNLTSSLMTVGKQNPANMLLQISSSGNSVATGLGIQSWRIWPFRTDALRISGTVGTDWFWTGTYVDGYPANAFASPQKLATHVPVMVLAATNQTANLTEWWNAASNTVASVSSNGGFISQKGFSSDGVSYAKMPTNAPTDGQILTAAGTAGYTKWADAGGGMVQTNADYTTIVGAPWANTNAATLYSPTLRDPAGEVVATFDGDNDTLRVTGKLWADQFDGSGSGLTNIARAGVNGLDDALYYLTNSISTGGEATNVIQVAGSPSVNVVSNLLLRTVSLDASQTNTFVLRTNGIALGLTLYGDTQIPQNSQVTIGGEFALSTTGTGDTALLQFQEVNGPSTVFSYDMANARFIFVGALGNGSQVITNFQDVTNFFEFPTSSATAWGDITGTIGAQTDLGTALATKTANNNGVITNATLYSDTTIPIGSQLSIGGEFGVLGEGADETASLLFQEVNGPTTLFKYDNATARFTVVGALALGSQVVTNWQDVTNFFSVGAGDVTTAQLNNSSNVLRTLISVSTSGIPVTTTHSLATNAATGSQLRLNFEADDTLGLNFSTAGGTMNASQITVTPDTGELKLNSATVFASADVRAAQNISAAALITASSGSFTNEVTAVDFIGGTNTYTGVVNVAPTNALTPSGWMPITNAGVRFYMPLYQ